MGTSEALAPYWVFNKNHIEHNSFDFIVIIYYYSILAKLRWIFVIY